MAKENIGTVVQVIGATFDAEFSRGPLSQRRRLLGAESNVAHSKMTPCCSSSRKGDLGCANHLRIRSVRDATVGLSVASWAASSQAKGSAA